MFEKIVMWYLFSKDTSHKTVFPVFQEGGGLNLTEMSNAGDFIMLPLPHTFKILPWAPKIGWMLCDIYFSNAREVENILCMDMVLLRSVSC